MFDVGHRKVGGERLPPHPSLFPPFPVQRADALQSSSSLTAKPCQNRLHFFLGDVEPQVKAAFMHASCPEIDGGRGAASCPSVSGGTLWWILTPKPCTQASRGNLPLACVQGSTYELGLYAPGSCTFLISYCVSMSSGASFARIAAYSW